MKRDKHWRMHKGRDMVRRLDQAKSRIRVLGNNVKVIGRTLVRSGNNGFSFRVSLLVYMGELIKSVGRAIITFSGEPLVRWKLKFFHWCRSGDAEIHLPGEVYCCRIDEIYQKSFGRDLVLVLKGATRHKDFNATKEVIGDYQLVLTNYKVPIVIKDNESGYDCVWFGFNRGYVGVYFSKPPTHRSWN